ncbi:MAG: L,D-transpeptidase, partial [Sciscionella sp.]
MRTPLWSSDRGPGSSRARHALGARGIAVATLLTAAAITLAACSTSGRGTVSDSHADAGVTSFAPTALPTGLEPLPAPTGSLSSSRPVVPQQPVHVSLFQGDGQTYGIGFAIMADFDVAPTDSYAFTHAVTVTANGRPAGGAWFWQRSGARGVAIEALYRPKSYWPAHARIHVNMPLTGLSAGRGLAYDDSLTLSIATGARNISTVDNTTHRMTVTSDGKLVRVMPVSLGSGDHPTYRGTKVVMEKDNPERMISTPGEPYYNVLVPWSVRITTSGEFVHAASWNTGNIGSRNTSHGCTNLDVGDAKLFYHFSQLGDVVKL